MRFHVLPLPLCIAALCAPAAATPDPFDTAAQTPPRPVRQGQGSDNFDAPCPEPRFETPLGVLEVVDLALCNNPQTRDLWANARAQAAQVGVAQSAYWPDLDGKLSTGHVDGSSLSGRQNSASLTLSWLLVDFGARAAHLENARQLLAAAAATLDATVQAVFLRTCLRSQR